MRETLGYFGKYRGVVTNNKDELHLGRIKAEVLAVFGKDNESSWALPCVPYAGNGVGFFFIPPKHASVWIEFEQGDSDYPIWTGCYWDEKDKRPTSPAIADTKVLKTDNATITLDDKKDILTIETKGGMKIMMDRQGIKITNGNDASVKLNGKKVSINDTALEVE